MYSVPVNLLLYYLGFGYVLFLAWAIVLSDAIKTNPPRWTRTATTVLQVIGIAHPAAALAAWTSAASWLGTGATLTPGRVVVDRCSAPCRWCSRRWWSSPARRDA